MKITKTQDGQFSVDIFGSFGTDKGKKIAIASTVLTLLVAGGGVFVYQMHKQGVAFSALIPSFERRPEPVAVAPQPSAPAAPETTNNPSGGLQVSQKHLRALEAYRAKLETIDGVTSLISGVGSGYSDGYVTVVVTSAFIVQPKALRLEMATALANVWEEVYGPSRSEHTRIELVTSQGTTVGGQEGFGGVYVDD